MGRKKKQRAIALDMSGICTSFGPHGMEGCYDEIGQIVMYADELQTLQYKDGDGLTMVQGAAKMGISKSVFGTIYKSAREKLVQMVLEQQMLLIKCPCSGTGDE